MNQRQLPRGSTLRYVYPSDPATISALRGAAVVRATAGAFIAAGIFALAMVALPPSQDSTATARGDAVTVPTSSINATDGSSFAPQSDDTLDSQLRLDWNDNDNYRMNVYG